MSLNGMSITPPLSSNKLPQQQYQQQIQLPFFQSFNSQPWLPNVQQTNGGQFSQQQQQQNMMSNMNSNPYSSLFSNPTELSPFNQDQSHQQKMMPTATTNRQQSSDFMFTESFENGSIFEDVSKFELGGPNSAAAFNEDFDYMEMEYMRNKIKSGIGGIGGMGNTTHLDTHHNSMIKFYEEEEKNIEFEIKQDEKLLIVLAQEAKLTRQLSVEQLIHFAHLNQFEKKKNSPFVKNNSDIENDENEVLICRVYL